jgi:hypothetical protein
MMAALALMLTFATASKARNNSEIIDLAPGWQRVELDAPPGSLSLPTVKYAPNDHRNASLLITILGRGNNRVKDRESLNEFERYLCQRYLSKPTDPFEAKDFTTPNAIGTYASFEDPALKGKPEHTGDYKFATVAALLLNNQIVVFATIYTDEDSGRTFDEALSMLKSVDLK